MINLNLLDYQVEAIKRVRTQAQAKETEHQELVEEFCKPFDTPVSALINRILSNPVTINFHPDRFSNNGKTIIENLINKASIMGNSEQE